MNPRPANRSRSGRIRPRARPTDGGRDHAPFVSSYRSLIHGHPGLGQRPRPYRRRPFDPFQLFGGAGYFERMTAAYGADRAKSIWTRTGNTIYFPNLMTGLIQLLRHLQAPRRRPDAGRVLDLPAGRCADLLLERTLMYNRLTMRRPRWWDTTISRCTNGRSAASTPTATNGSISSASTSAARSERRNSVTDGTSDRRCATSSGPGRNS